MNPLRHRFASFNPQRFSGFYRVACWGVVASIVLHVLAPLTSPFHAEGWRLLGAGMMWFAAYWLLMKVWRFAAYLGFLFGLVGFIAALSGAVDPMSYIPSVVYIGIILADSVIIIGLFVILWQDKPSGLNKVTSPPNET